MVTKDLGRGDGDVRWLPTVPKIHAAKWLAVTGISCTQPRTLVGYHSHLPPEYVDLTGERERERRTRLCAMRSKLLPPGLKKKEKKGMYCTVYIQNVA